MRLHIVMYHYVRQIKGSRYSDIKGLELSNFRKQLNFLCAKFEIISMDRLLEMRAGGKPIPENSALLTFDDGYIDHYTNVFPLLLQRGIKGAFFSPAKTIMESVVLDVNKIHFLLASSPIEKLNEKLFSLLDFYRGQEYAYPSIHELYEKYAKESRFDTKEVIFFKRILQVALPEKLRGKLVDTLFAEMIPISEEAFAKELYMTMDQIKAMHASGMYFGLHGYNHHWYEALDYENMRSDIQRSLDVFDPVMDRSNFVMCYPYGSYCEETINYLGSIGGKVGLTTEVRVADIGTSHWLALPRLDTNDYPPQSQQNSLHQ